MSLRKIANKLDAVGEDSNPNIDVLSYTTPQVLDSTKTWTYFFEVVEHEIIKFQEDSSKEDDKSYTTKLRHVAQSKFHNITA
jgi:hypothetical protein